jgi:hypothetical protein
MNFIQNITLKKSFLIYFFLGLVNIVIIGFIYNSKFFPIEYNEYKKISEFFIAKFQEKDISIVIKKDEIVLGKENYLIDNTGFPVELSNKNLIYISKSANYADFKDKDTLAILNDKEIVLNINNEYQNLPLNSLLQESEEIKLDSNGVQEFITKNYLENNQLRNLLYAGFGLDRVFNLIIVLIWSYLILGYLSYYLLKFSGYTTEKNITQSLALLYGGIFLLIQPIFYFLNQQINLVYVFFIGFLIISLYLKYVYEKKL